MALAALVGHRRAWVRRPGSAKMSPDVQASGAAEPPLAVLQQAERAAGQVERLTVDTLRTVLDTALAAVRSTLR